MHARRRPAAPAKDPRPLPSLIGPTPTTAPRALLPTYTLGIGRPTGNLDVATYVLQDFRSSEMADVDGAVAGALFVWGGSRCAFVRGTKSQGGRAGLVAVHSRGRDERGGGGAAGRWRCFCCVVRRGGRIFLCSPVVSPALPPVHDTGAILSKPPHCCRVAAHHPQHPDAGAGKGPQRPARVMNKCCVKTPRLEKDGGSRLWPRAAVSF